jgi:hypothetical protein
LQNGPHADVYDQVEALETAIIKAAAEKGHIEQRQQQADQSTADGEGSSAQDLHISLQEENNSDSLELTSTPVNTIEPGNLVSRSPFNQAPESPSRSTFSIESPVPAVHVVVDSQADKLHEQSIADVMAPPSPPAPPAPPSSSPPPPPTADAPSLGAKSGPSMSSPSKLDQHDLEAVAAAAKFGK